MVEERVGRGGDVDGGPGKSDGGCMLAPPCQRLGPHAAPGDGRVEVVAGERLALVAECFGLRGAILILLEERETEQRGGACGVDPEPVGAESIVCSPEALLRLGGVP